VTGFKVFLHRKAEKSLYALPKHVLRKVYDFLSDLGRNPLPWRTWDIRKIRGEENTYRVRLNKYRIVYWVNWKAKEIVVLKVELRKKVYK